MLKVIKIRLYPSKEQVVFINKQLGCCRFVYNRCLLYRSCSSMKHLLERFNLLDELFPNRLRVHKITFEEAKEAASHYKNTNKI